MGNSACSALNFPREPSPVGCNERRKMLTGSSAGWPSFETIGKRLQNEHHLKRLLSDYVRYHHADRTHLGLEKATPDGRIRSVASGPVLSQERLGGLHHRYDRAAA